MSYIIFFMCIAIMGWIFGVWVPWWGVCILIGLTIWKLNKVGNLGDVLGSCVLALLTFVATSSCFINGGVTLTQVGEFISIVFTGGK